MRVASILMTGSVKLVLVVVVRSDLVQRLCAATALALCLNSPGLTAWTSNGDYSSHPLTPPGYNIPP